MKKKILSITLSAAILIGALAACQTGPPPSPGDTQPPVTPPGGPVTPEPPPPPPPPADAPLGRGLIIATANEAPSITVGRHNSLTAGFKNVTTHNGLFRQDYATLNPVPDLVATWTAVSDTVFDFTIYEGIMFHNGDIMNAYDIAASLEYLRKTPDARSAHQSIESWEVLDELTIRIDTGEPNAMLFIDLAHTGNFVVPRSLIESGHDFSTQPVGSGPYVFEEWRLGDSLHFSIFENYFDTARAGRVESLTWRIIPEGSSRTIALEAGEVDYIVEVPFSDIPRLEADPNVHLLTRPGTGHFSIILNTEIAPFDNMNVRRAIDMAIDREALVIAGFEGLAVPTNQSVPNVFAGASTQNTRPFDPEAARALLAGEGIAPGDLSFELLVDNEERRRMAEVAQANLLDIGIETTIAMNDMAASLQRQSDGDYDAAFGGFTASNLLGFMRAMLTTEPDRHNRSRIDHPDVNELIFTALTTIDTARQVALLEEASSIVNYYSFLIPTHQALVIRAFNANLVSPEISATGAMNLNMVFWAE